MIFGYKDMEESMGPCEDGCPESILNLLTSTDNENALDWRRRCLAKLQQRTRKVEDGDRVKLADALTFTDGHVGDEFIVQKRGRRMSFRRSEEHTSELQSLMRSSYAVFCLQKKT